MHRHEKPPTSEPLPFRRPCGEPPARRGAARPEKAAWLRRGGARDTIAVLAAAALATPAGGLANRIDPSVPPRAAALTAGPPVAFSGAQLSVPAAWPVVDPGTSTCQDERIAGVVLLGTFGVSAWCLPGSGISQAPPANVVRIGPLPAGEPPETALPEVLRNGIPTYAVTLHGRVSGKAWLVPSLGAEVMASGPQASAVLATLAASVRARVLAARSSPPPPSPRHLDFAGLGFDVPASWPLEHTKVAGDGCLSEDWSAAFSASEVVLDTDASGYEALPCPYIPPPRVAADALVVSKGSAKAPNRLPADGRALVLNGLHMVVDPTAELSVLVVDVEVPGRSMPVEVRIGLGDAATAAAVLDSIRASSASSSASTGSSTTGSTSSERVPSSATTSPAQQAASLARALLDSLRLPPGAHSAPSLPPALDEPAASIAAPQQVHLVDRFVLPAVSPAGLQAFLRSHPPAGSTTTGYGTGGQDGTTTTWEVTYTPGRPPPAVYQSSLVVTIADLGTGSALRADAEAAYEYPHPAAAEVPGDVAAAVVSRHVPGRASPAQEVRLEPGPQLSKIVGVFDATPLSPPGAAFSCPADFGVTLQVSFPATASTPPLRAVLDNCSLIVVTLGGEHGPTLRDLPGSWGGELAQLLAGALGFHSYAVWR
ncbi:MAG TPA: hypothetical protein VMD59_14335 [Acidimicrobiales bacterium]|nr:hypothetical protein [Acidimicrobiales bacterium]